MGPFLIFLLISSVKGIPKTKCNRLKVGDKFYDREVLWANVGRPYNLIVNKQTNTLFFSYSSLEPYADVDFQLAYYSIDNQEHQTIAGIRGGCTTAIDNESEDIYVGGSDGIHKFNMLTKIADFYKEKGQNIWYLFYKKNLFYIKYPDQRLHLEVDGKFAVVKEFADFQIDNFYVTVFDEIFFANQTGLFKFDSDRRKIVILNEMLQVRQFAEDNDGNLFICTNVGILMDSKVDGFKKIVDHKGIFGLTFDRDNNFIISDTNSLLKLRISEKNCEGADFHW